MKYSEIKEEFSAKGLKKASEELDILRLSEAERAAYERYIEAFKVAESSIKTSWFEGKIVGVEEGRKEGREEGELKRNRDIAIEMIKDDEPNDKIRRYTHLTDAEIEQLKRTIPKIQLDHR